ncbi:MAG: hypothetical protein WC554_02020 [Clostridia bacterium]|jgi:hypothetical protein
MATALRQVISICILILACLLSLASFGVGISLYYLDISKSVGNMLLSLSGSLIIISSLFKNYGDVLDQSTITKNAYYFAIFLTACIVTVSQFSCAVWLYFTESMQDIASSLLMDAINMCCICVFLKSLSGKEIETTNKNVNETDNTTETKIITDVKNNDIKEDINIGKLKDIILIDDKEKLGE